MLFIFDLIVERATSAETFLVTFESYYIKRNEWKENCKMIKILIPVGCSDKELNQIIEYKLSSMGYQTPRIILKNLLN